MFKIKALLTKAFGAAHIPKNVVEKKPGKRRRLLFLLLALFHTLGALSSLDALMSSRTSQGSIAWIISLNTFPYAAVPAYWVFGRSRFQGYVISRKEADNELFSKHQLKTANVEQYLMAADRIRGNIAAIEQLAKLPFLSANHAKLLIDGEQTFASIFDGIQRAEHYILVQFYIVRDDTLGRQLQQLLIEKARSGVAVYFLFDEIGSYRLSKRYIRELDEAGVAVRPFHSTKGPGNRFQLNFRNHRKIVITDGHYGWLGGLNVGDEYLGQDPRFGEWRDTHMRLSGPAVLSLQLSFVEDWFWSSEQLPTLNWQAKPANGADMPVLIVPSGPADRFETASLMIQHALNSATERIWIASPYFVPDEGTIAALKLAALRGVDVRILIPERTDNMLVSLAAYAFVAPLLDAGVKIYRYQQGFLHAKSFLVDDQISAVGTVNLDNRSFRLNFEITALVADITLNAQLSQQFRADFALSRQMSLAEVLSRPWYKRAASQAANLLSPVL
ncbi:cardiolipin synthetase [Arsukibacterium ikkense]|uniref:Cardiolipin synthase n=1 Tax=Arsukibacterium ikkense TaxID=336831 RepID=A0A0M2VAB8_9GAMM|nr:cardiolipin synthase [Arsukibacterium ikkense]KKO46580.1 cardiolipin synthetase [Arsukibacterium ikkense]